jgi:hypothetical protein
MKAHGSTTVPRYFFHLTDGTDVLDDPDGLELPGDAAARDEAVLVAADVKTRFKPRDWTGWFVQIIDDKGRQIDQIPVIVTPQA